MWDVSLFFLFFLSFCYLYGRKKRKKEPETETPTLLFFVSLCCVLVLFAVEDDGLLIGRDQNGLQGFVLCSFLVSFSLCSASILSMDLERWLTVPLPSRLEQHPIEVSE